MNEVEMFYETLEVVKQDSPELKRLNDRLDQLLIKINLAADSHSKLLNTLTQTAEKLSELKTSAKNLL